MQIKVICSSVPIIFLKYQLCIFRLKDIPFRNIWHLAQSNLKIYSFFIVGTHELMTLEFWFSNKLFRILWKYESNNELRHVIYIEC